MLEGGEVMILRAGGVSVWRFVCFRGKRKELL